MLSGKNGRFLRQKAFPWGQISVSILVIGIMLLSTGCAPAVVDTLLKAKASPTIPATAAVPATGKGPASNAGSSSVNPSANAAKATLTPTVAQGMAGMTTENTSEGQVAAVKVSDQPLKNGAVTIDLVTSPGPGWVVIYTVGANGQPDQAIGHAAIKAGLNPNVVVQVDAAKATGALNVQLHADKGVIGTFEFPGPDEPVMSGVQMIASTFKITQAEAAGSAGANGQPTAQANMNNMSGMNATQPANANANPPANGQMTPNIIVANQPIKDGKIVIPEVDSVGNAWLVIHKENGDGSLGAMAGFAHVTDGVNKNVVVQLDLNSTSTVMYAMLHQDQGIVNKLEYPGPDEPVIVNGQMIAPKFEVTSNSTADVVVALGSMPETAHTLVDGHDMSLYISLRDTPGKSNCAGDCANTWLPLLATGRIVAGSGIDASKLGVILRADGMRQVTYMNAPLYLYSKDTKPGDVSGQGFDGTWYLVTP